MIKKKKLLLFILIAIVFVQCKSISKFHKKKEEKKSDKTEVEIIADGFFYYSFSKKLGYDLEGSEEKEFVKMVDAWLGVPYKYGGCSKEGTDCSCFVSAFYRDYFKVNLPRKSEDMQKLSMEIDASDLQTGDLLFFKIKSEKVSHVGIYISKKHFVHATTSKGVMINSLDENYYKTYFLKAGRIRE